MLLPIGIVLCLGGSVAPLLAQGECVVVDDFSKAAVGAFPEGWKARKESGNDVYKVAEDGGKRFLRADASDIGVQAGKKFEWDLNEYPVLAWAWRRLVLRSAKPAPAPRAAGPLRSHPRSVHAELATPPGCSSGLNEP